MTRSRPSGSAAASHEAAIPGASARRYRRHPPVSRGARSPAGARNVLRAIYASIQLIAEHPLSYQRTDNPDIRVHVVQRYRYKIFYNADGDTIEIIHVRHTSRRPWVSD